MFVMFPVNLIHRRQLQINLSDAMLQMKLVYMVVTTMVNMTEAIRYTADFETILVCREKQAGTSKSSVGTASARTTRAQNNVCV